MRMIAAILAGAALCGAAAQAQDASPFDVRHDADIPTAAEVLGHEFGAEITPPEDAIDYLLALEEAAPDRIRVFDYAESWEGRTLAYAVIARPEILAQTMHASLHGERCADRARSGVRRAPESAYSTSTPESPACSSS